MRYYKLILKGGHVGNKKYYEHVRYFEAINAVKAWLDALDIPRIKKGNNGCSIISVTPISYMDYLLGKEREKQDPYLNSNLSYCKVVSSRE